MIRGLYFAFVLGLFVGQLDLSMDDPVFWLLLFGGNAIYQLLPKGE